MEKINAAELMQVLQRNESTELARNLPSSLSDGEYSSLVAAMEKLSRRYNTQDVSESIEEYTEDLERLSVKYSLQAVLDALAELRIDPEQTYFPKPDEVAWQIERKRDKAIAECVIAVSEDRRKEKVKEFWQWAPQWMQETGMTEAELYKRWPSMKGTKEAA